MRPSNARFVEPPPTDGSVSGVLRRIQVRFAALHHANLRRQLPEDVFWRGRNLMLWLGHHAGHPFFYSQDASTEIEDTANAFEFRDYTKTITELEAFMRHVETETRYRRRTDSMGLPL